MDRNQQLDDLLGTLVLSARHSHLAGLLSRAQMVDKVDGLLQNGRFEEAYTLAKQLSGHDDGFAREGRLLQMQILDALVNERIQQGRYSDCLYYLAEWSQLAPENLYPPLRRAEILQHDMGQLEEAVAELFQLVERAPRCVEAWVQLAYTALSAAKADTWQAGGERSKPSSHVPHRISDAVRFAIRAWRALRSPQWAYEPYQPVVMVVIELLYEVSARTLLLCGLRDEAVDILHHAQDVMAHRFSLQRFEVLHQPTALALKAASKKVCRRLLQVVDHDLAKEVIAAAACCDNVADLLEDGNYEHALGALRQFKASAKFLLRQRYHQLQVKTLGLLAEKQRSLGDLSAELQSIEQWGRIEPTNLFARFRRAEILSSQGELRVARLILQKLLRICPYCVDAWTELASIDFRCRRPTRAIRHLLKAWNSLQSPQWAYYPSESVVRVGIEALVYQTAILLCRFRKCEDALEILGQAKRQLATSEQIDRLIKQVERVLRQESILPKEEGGVFL